MDYVEIFCMNLPHNADQNEISRFLENNLYDHHGKFFMICYQRWLKALMIAKGYSSLKAILVALAFHPHMRLVDVAKSIGASLPATKDYLKSLIEVGLIVHIQKHYKIRDPVLRKWLTNRVYYSLDLNEWVDTKVDDDRFAETD